MLRKDGSMVSQTHIFKVLTVIVLLAKSVQAGAASELVSLSLGTQSADGGVVSIQGESTSESLNFDSGTSVALGWGVGSETSRFMFEFYSSSIDFNSSESLDKSSVFYSGYWTPTLLFGIKGIVGGGVGVSYIELPERASLGSPKFKNRGVEYKLSLGLDYQLNPKIGFYTLVEHIRGDDYTDSYLAADGETAKVAAFADDDQVRASVGLTFSF